MADKIPLIKTISLAVVSAVFALIFGLFFKSFINLGGLSAAVFLLVTTTLFLAVFLIQTLLLDSFLVNLIITAIDAALIAIVFIGNFPILILAAAAVMAILLLAGYYAARLELKNNLDIRFFKTAGYVMKYASSALAIFAVITYLALLNLEDATAAKRVLASVIKPIEPITGAYIPGFTIDDPLTEISRKIMPNEIKSASSAVQTEFIRASSVRLAGAIEGFIKVSVVSSDSILDVFYKSTVAKLLKMGTFARNLILAGAGLLAFFMLKFLLVFVDWLATAIGFGIYRLLLGAEFFHIELQSKTKKTIVLGNEMTT